MRRGVVESVEKEKHTITRIKEIYILGLDKKHGVERSCFPPLCHKICKADVN